MAQICVLNFVKQIILYVHASVCEAFDVRFNGCALNLLHVQNRVQATVQIFRNI